MRNIAGVGDLRAFDRVLRALALRHGQLLNLAAVSRDFSVSHSTTTRWLDVLLACGLVVLLEPWHRNLGKRLVKSPKLYFADAGLAAWLCGYSTPGSLSTGPHAGAFFEGHVVMQWLQHRDLDAPGLRLSFWQDRSGHEVDLVLEHDGRVHAVECKLSEMPDARDAANLERFRGFLGVKAVHSCTVAAPYPRLKTLHDVAPGVVARSGFTAWTL